MGRHKSTKNLAGGSARLRFEIASKGMLYYHFIRAMAARDYAYGTTKSYYYGVCVPPVKAMEAIADVLNIPLDEIIKWYEPIKK